MADYTPQVFDLNSPNNDAAGHPVTIQQLYNKQAVDKLKVAKTNSLSINDGSKSLTAQGVIYNMDPPNPTLISSPDIRVSVSTSITSSSGESGGTNFTSTPYSSAGAILQMLAEGTTSGGVTSQTYLTVGEQQATVGHHLPEEQLSNTAIATKEMLNKRVPVQVPSGTIPDGTVSGWINNIPATQGYGTSGFRQFAKDSGAISEVLIKTESGTDSPKVVISAQGDISDAPLEEVSLTVFGGDATLTRSKTVDQLTNNSIATMGAIASVANGKVDNEHSVNHTDLGRTFTGRFVDDVTSYGILGTNFMVTDITTGALLSGVTNTSSGGASGLSPSHTIEAGVVSTGTQAALHINGSNGDVLVTRSTPTADLVGTSVITKQDLINLGLISA